MRPSACATPQPAPERDAPAPGHPPARHHEPREYPARVHLARVLRAVMGGAARRPVAVSLAVGLLAVAGGPLAPARLHPSAAPDTLVGRATASFAATEELHRKF